MATKKINPAIFLPTWHVYNVKFLSGIQKLKVADTCDPTGGNRNAVLSQGIYSTEVNIFNYHTNTEAHIYKYFVPLVIENKVIGFEPRQQHSKRIAEIVLRPDSATGDDGCGIEKILGVSNMLNIGFLKIVSSVDLTVTAVYTVADLENKVASIDVKQIDAKLVSMFQF
jgi:hypothetical protein